MLEHAAEAARLWFDRCELAPLGAGHIHDTYLVQRESEKYVLQRVNEVVFTDGDLVMAQTARVLRHLGAGYPLRKPALMRSRNGFNSERHGDGLWRVWSYLDGTTVVDPIEHPAQAEAAGRAFGTLQACLRGLPGPQLEDTIPGFLQLDHYLRAFEEVAPRATTAHREIVARHADLAHAFADRNTLVHGDCKVNNLLFDEGRRTVEAVIDFDTVMFGHWAWDVGDLLRSICFSRGGVDLEFCHAAIGGFLPACSPPGWQPRDFALAPSYIALMLGVRFLTDHLCGDLYFKVRRRGDNLRRADEQFGLLDEFVANAKPIERLTSRLGEQAKLRR